MRRLTTVLVTLSAAVAVLAPTTTAHADKIPEPAQDPFYAVPADVGSYAPGAVIAARAVTTIVYIAKIPARSWQIKYRTTDSHGDPTATVTTLMVPSSTWKTGSRPLVSYQVAEDAVGDQCAPSYGLRAGILKTVSNGAAESGLMAGALSKGWAVTVPDYEGPNSEFLSGRLEGQAVLDGIRASLAFTPAGLPASTPVGMWGYSGGALASSIAAQLQSAYAPEINMQAIALGGVVANIRATIGKFSGSALGGAIAMGVNGPMRANPDFDFSPYISAAGAKKIQAASDDCISDAVGRYPFLKFDDLTSYKGAFDAPPVLDLLWRNSPLGIEGMPTAPVYDYHAKRDEFAPIGPDRQLMQRYCAAGAVVEHVEKPIGEHVTEVVAGAAGAIAFLNQRFTGTAPRNTCATIPAP